MRKFKKRWLLILVFVSILSTSAFNRKYKEVGAEEAETTVVKPYEKPTGNANRFLGIWLSSGYILQPAKDTYVEVNNTKTLRGEAGRSAVMQIITAPYIMKRYQWYKSTDGKTWGKVSSKQSGNKQNLPVTPTSVGTTYYQLDVYFETVLGLTTASHLYSDVATVHAVPEPVDAKSVKVTTDDDYIYNSDHELVNSQTYAHAHPDPENFTGEVTWSISDTSLATIDPESGLIQANLKKLSGKVTVTATMHNPIGEDITGETTLTIGEGLEDQTVRAGQSATFDLRGNFSELDDEAEDNNYTVKWYMEDPITHSPKQVQKDNLKALSYTIPDTTLDDDGTIVYAIVQVRYNGKDYSYITGKAMLHVLPIGGPNLELTNTLSNETFKDKSDSDKVLFGVNNDDVIKYSDTVTNNSTSGTLTDAKYTLPLRQGARVTSIKVDGVDVSDDNYKMETNDDTGNTDLVISGLNFKIRESHKIEVETVVTGIDQKTKYTTIPYITGTSDEDEKYQKFGDDETLNYTTNTVVIQTVREIDYGTVNAINPEKTLHRQDELNLPNNVMEVDDMRRYKKALTVTVDQDGPLQNDNGDIFSGHLRYYDNGTYKNLLEEPAVIAQTNDDEELLSLGWDRDNGILLFLESKWNAAGTYRTSVNWTITDSVAQ